MYWGISAGGPPIASLESKIGHPFDIVYFFHGVDSGRIPNEQERALASNGHLLHINLEARLFTKPGHPAVRWSEVAAGAFDGPLREIAHGFADIGKPFFITFDHEPDAPPKLRARGSPAEFVAAWRHVRQVFLDSGAHQAIWTWVVTGYPPNFGHVAALYPGNSAVDWISWDPYDLRGCQGSGVGSSPAQTFADVAAPFYNWLATEGVRAGISLDKPYMISETGSAVDPRDAAASAAYYRSIPAGLKKLPRIRAVTLWDQSAGGCSYRLDDVSQVESALRMTASALRTSRK